MSPHSHVNDNPLSFTDPSGYFLSGFFHWFGHHGQMIAAVVVAIVASVVAQQWESWGWVAAMAGGFASGLIASNGNLQDGLIGAAAVLAFYGIGYQFQNTIGVVGDRVGAFVQKVAERGIVGGLASEAEGGRFASGFLSTAVPEVLSSATNNFEGLDSPEKVAAAAVLGGTASVLGGGKFGNGAVTAAFLQAMVNAASYYKQTVSGDPDMAPGDTLSADEKGLCCDYTWGPGGYTPGPNVNVFGLNAPLDGSFWDDFFKQGVHSAHFMNEIPGFNATVQLHDVWFNSGSFSFNPFTNTPLMLPAAAITYGAVLGVYLRGWDSNPMVWYYMSRPHG